MNIKKLYILACSILFCAHAHATTQAVNGLCSVGGTRVSTSGLQSSNTVVGSYPNCTVTVYLTGTTTLAPVFSDGGGTTLSNPFTANNNAAWLFYAASGVGLDIVMTGGTPVPFPDPFTLVDVSPGGGGGGGGNVNPGNQRQIAGYPQAGTVALVGPNPQTLDYVSSSVQGQLNSDQIGGVAAAAANSQCVSSECTIDRPSNSSNSDSYPQFPADWFLSGYNGILGKNVRVTQSTGSVSSDYVENPHGIGHYVSSIDYSPGEASNHVTISTIDINNGTYFQNDENTSSSLAIFSNHSALEISHGETIIGNFWGAGDKTIRDDEFTIGALGYGNPDDESVEGARLTISDNGIVPVLTITGVLPISNPSDPDHVVYAQGLRNTNVLNQNTSGAGRWVFLTKNADGSSANTLPGCSVTAFQDEPFAGNPPSFTVAGCTPPVSTFIGQITEAIPTPRNFNVPQSMPGLFVSTTQGTFLQNGPVCISDGHRFEQANVTAGGGTAVVTLSVINAFVAFAWIYQDTDGLCGQAALETAGTLSRTGVSAQGQISYLMPILGVDSTGHVFYSVPTAGMFANVNHYYPFSAPVVNPAGFIQRVGNLVSLSVGPSFSAGLLNQTITITNAMDSSLNGTFVVTGISPNSNNLNQIYTYSQTGADVNNTVTVTSLGPAGSQNVGFYPSAMTLAPSNPNPESTWASTDSIPGAFLEVEDYINTWPVGGTITQAFGIQGGFVERSDTVTYNGPNGTGDHRFCQGYGCSNGFTWLTLQNLIDPALYSFNGGGYTPPDGIVFQGGVSSVLSVTNSAGGPSGPGSVGMLPQSNVFLTGCGGLGTSSDLCATRPDQTFYFLNSETNNARKIPDQGGAYVAVDQYHDEIWMAVQSQLGEHNEMHIGADYLQLDDELKTYLTNGILNLGFSRTSDPPTLTTITGSALIEMASIANGAGHWKITPGMIQSLDDLSGAQGNITLNAANFISLAGSNMNTGHCLALNNAGGSIVTVGSLVSTGNVADTGSGGTTLGNCVTKITAGTGITVTPNPSGAGTDVVQISATPPSGVTASGSACTITAITNGIITAATCTP